MTKKERHLEAAEELLAQNAPEDALGLLQELLRHLPEGEKERALWRGYALLGACFHDLADPEGAAEAYFLAAQHGQYLRSQREHFSNYLFALHYLPGISGETMLEQHRLYGTLYRDEIPLVCEARPHGGKHRIGYLAPAVLEQSTARFYEPLLSMYDREQFEVFCYSLSCREDAFTERMKPFTHFRCLDLERISIEEAAQCIQADGIDILFDLGGHSAGGITLQIMGRRPAPRQLSGIGYFDTTGLPAMDALLADSRLAPKGEESLFTERLLRLTSAFCYVPEESMRAMRRPSGAEDSPVAFGCFCNFMKLHDELLRMFREIAEAVPGARLVLQDVTRLPSRKRSMERRLRRLGIPENLFSVRLARESYLSDLQETDILLDPWPYPGGAMTCAALYMGTPVVSLRGDRYGARFGASLLEAAGLPELVAGTKEEYREKAVSLARDRSRLAQLQSGLRDRMNRSRLLDARSWMEEMEMKFAEWIEVGKSF